VIISWHIEFVSACFRSFKPATQLLDLRLYLQLSFVNIGRCMNFTGAFQFLIIIDVWPISLVFSQIIIDSYTWRSWLPYINKRRWSCLTSQTCNLFVGRVDYFAFNPIDRYGLVCTCESRPPNYECLPPSGESWSLADWVNHRVRSHSPALVSSKGTMSLRFWHRIGKAICKPYLRLRILWRLLVSDFGRKYVSSLPS